MNVEDVPAGLGSGFIWDTEGHVVTNYHVVKGASKIRVTLIDQSSFEAKVLGFDPDKDVAVLKLEMDSKKARTLRPVVLRDGDVGTLLVGQKVRLNWV
jgi:S1-C subfamily serine protease